MGCGIITIIIVYIVIPVVVHRQQRGVRHVDFLVGVAVIAAPMLDPGQHVVISTVVLRCAFALALEGVDGFRVKAQANPVGVVIGILDIDYVGSVAHLLFAAVIMQRFDILIDGRACRTAQEPLVSAFIQLKLQVIH